MSETNDYPNCDHAGSSDKRVVRKPCPACGPEGTDIRFGGHERSWFCETCGMSGPEKDPDGTKWDALPRRWTPRKGAAVLVRVGRDQWVEGMYHSTVNGKHSVAIDLEMYDEIRPIEEA